MFKYNKEKKRILAVPREIDPNKPLFTIGSVAEILCVKQRLLRLYEDRGLIRPSRTDGNRRLYSLKDIDVLAYIQYLTTVKKVNIAGVLEIQEILKKLDEKTRNQFMKEVEKEIEKLSKDQKRAYTGEEEILQNEIVKDVEKLDLIDTKIDNINKK